MDMYKTIDNLPDRKKQEKQEDIILKDETLQEKKVEQNIDNTPITIYDDTNKEEIPKDLTVTDLDMNQVKTQTVLDKAFSELFSKTDLELKTEFLKNSEIKNLGTLYAMARHYGFIALQERIIKHMQMRVSLKRKGRDEAVKLVQAERQHEEYKNMLDHYQRNDKQ